MSKKDFTDWRQVPLVIDLATAAALLHRSYDSVQKAARSGKFPAFRNGQRKWAITKDSLLAYIGDANRKGV